MISLHQRHRQPSDDLP